jgi:hypothetical protein
MKTIERYDSARAAVRDLGSEGFVAAVLGANRARKLSRWKDLVQEIYEGSIHCFEQPEPPPREPRDPFTTSGPSLSLG